MKLTNNFTLDELCHSNTAKLKKIRNNADEEQIENLRTLTIRLLQPLRDIYGYPMYINSGFRSQEVNKLVGGVPTSQHTKGQAADVRVENPRKLLSVLLQSGLIFDQAILYPTFLHLSYNTGNNRRQVLYAKGVKP
ncbi:peptidase M15 [Dysgonomonas sp. 216]|uniref:D-Ala-D-Ala carboxypeptidase family metallohydrolase n=1 Tax=Dysgonomonas sp. 216 TaxID=2302934 RepID=UPI0013D0EB6E|nr:D-Ala-D-Ala carboxypeptidase family metallohydrolase [Dysgonomonas sp. 216]NDW19785.1 peptidase M15 [Dysgonomonas sp. 216]